MAIDNSWTFITGLPGAGHILGLISEGEIIDKVPIIGFLVFSKKLDDKSGKFLNVVPATSEMVFDFDSQDYVIIRPDGHVDDPCGGSWNSIEACETELRSRWTQDAIAKLAP